MLDVSRFIVISNVRGNPFALQAVMEEASKLNIRTFVSAGNLVGLLPGNDEVLKLIKSKSFVLIRGVYELYFEGRVPYGHMREATKPLFKNARKYYKKSKLSRLMNDCILIDGLCIGSRVSWSEQMPFGGDKDVLMEVISVTNGLPTILSGRCTSASILSIDRSEDARHFIPYPLSSLSNCILFPGAVGMNRELNRGRIGVACYAVVENSTITFCTTEYSLEDVFLLIENSCEAARSLLYYYVDDNRGNVAGK